MGSSVDLRLKPPDVGISVLPTKLEVNGIEQKSSTVLKNHVALQKRINFRGVCVRNVV